MEITMNDLVRVEGHGTIVLVWPQTKDVRRWLEEHTDGTWFGRALVVEPRYVEDLLIGLWDSGVERA